MTLKTSEMKNNYSVTIGYRAVLEVSVNAESEEEAKEIALEHIELMRGRLGKGKITLNDDRYKVAGVLNMNDSWIMVQND